jgi:hypothetical protein
MGNVWCPPLDTYSGIFQLSWLFALELWTFAKYSQVTIDYLVHLSYLKVLEHVILSTSHHSIQQGFAKDYAVLSIDQQ